MTGFQTPVFAVQMKCVIIQAWFEPENSNLNSSPKECVLSLHDPSALGDKLEVWAGGKKRHKSKRLVPVGGADISWINPDAPPSMAYAKCKTAIEIQKSLASPFPPGPFSSTESFFRHHHPQMWLDIAPQKK